MSEPNITRVVREKYAKAALKVTTGRDSGCCSSTAASSCGDPITGGLYAADEAAAVPDDALRASLGCGNPTALAELSPGEVVLDLGSGGGIDVLLSARRVGPTGKAYGLDVTDEMLALARENQRKAGVTNVEFLKGEIEQIPLPDASVDVIISNCVINLSADKARVLQEAFRVLKPGGRLAVSDIVVRGEVPAAIRRSVELWIGCVAGALDEQEYREKLAPAGFEAIDVQPSRIYRAEDAREFLLQAALDADAIAPQVDGKFMSAFVRGNRSGLSGRNACGANGVSDGDGEQRWGGMTLQYRETGLRDVVDNVALLALERRGHGQHARGEAASGGTVSPEALPPPEDRRTQRTLGGVVRRLHAGDLDERPERRGQRQHLATGGGGLGVPTRRPSPQPGLDPPPVRPHRGLEPRPRQGPIPHPMP